MVWTAICANELVLSFNTSANCIREATDHAREEARMAGSWLICLVKGKVENNVYFV